MHARLANVQAAKVVVQLKGRHGDIASNHNRGAVGGSKVKGHGQINDGRQAPRTLVDVQWSKNGCQGAEKDHNNSCCQQPGVVTATQAQTPGTTDLAVIHSGAAMAEGIIMDAQP
jgi:hypothetical protein